MESACCVALAALGSGGRGGLDGASVGAFPAGYRERAPVFLGGVSLHWQGTLPEQDAERPDGSVVNQDSDLGLAGRRRDAIRGLKPVVYDHELTDFTFRTQPCGAHLSWCLLIACPC